MTLKKATIYLIIFALMVGVGAYLLGRGVSMKRARDAKVAEQLILQNEENAWEDSLKATYDIDKDFDNLTDAEELKLGTNSRSADTDKDGLSDGTEVNFLKTNPLKADTDGDGVLDGIEVSKGTNPLK